MIDRNTFVLAVQNLAESANYYESVLGFKVLEIGDDGWRLYERGPCQIMAWRYPHSSPAQDLGDHSYFAHLVLDSADRYCAKIFRYGAEIIKPGRSEPWGMREFTIRTNDGHRIMFGEELKS